MADNEKVQEAVVIHEAASALAPAVADIEAQIERMNRMEKALEKIRTSLVRATLPSDWQKFGDGLFLEGDGALRLAPLLGLRITNKTMTTSVRDDGVIEATCSADFEATLFETKICNVARTRRDDDDFLTQNHKIPRADLADVKSAAEKGCIGRGVQMVAGLSGINVDEMEARYGFKFGAKAVEFRTGKSEAKQADRAATSEPVKEIHKLLLMLSQGDEQEAGSILEKITANTSKGWAGKTDPNKLTEAGIKFVLPKLQKMAEAFERELQESEGLGE